MSGLPVNTFSQAAEYRNQYLANLALTVQNDMYNLNANQVYRQTGQPSRPPDTRSTTEKLADLEGLKVSLRSSLLGITDGTQANETIDQLTPDEVIFASQQMPVIIEDLKPRFARGVPANALLNYIRALRRKELQTNGVSFTAQESTAQQILNAIQNGVNILGANPGPIPPIRQEIRIPPVKPEPVDTPIKKETPIKREPVQQTLEEAMEQAGNRRQEQVRRAAEEWLSSGTEPFTTLPRNVQDMVNVLQAEKGKSSSGGEALLLGRFKQEVAFKEAAENDYLLDNIDNWIAYPKPGSFIDYPDNPEIQKEYLKMWAKIQPPEVKAAFDRNWSRKRTVDSLKQALYPGWRLKFESAPMPVPSNPRNLPIPRMQRDVSQFTDTDSPFMTPTIMDTSSMVSGLGITRPIRRAFEPVSRFPSGRQILGYGLAKPKLERNNEYVGIGVAEISYSPFGKYVLNTNKLASNILDIRTPRGKQLSKYKQRQMSDSLAKTMKRIMGGRMIDEYDFNEMPLEDQSFLWNLATDAKIMDRLQLPTPKRTKEGEEENRFEILKGQICAGNDSKELVKEFKSLLLKFSNDGRIKKSEAREILLDLTALGH